MTTIKRCACGWERPLISVMMGDGSRPPDDIVLIYSCPRCATVYLPGGITVEEAAELRKKLKNELKD